MNYSPKHKQLSILIFIEHHYQTQLECFSYVNQFLKLKTQASGWPKWVMQGTEEQVELNKEAFIKAYEQKEGKIQRCRDEMLINGLSGIRLDPDQVVYNAVLRFLAKLMLNR